MLKLEDSLIFVGMLFHSFIAVTVNDLPPSVSRLYFGQTKVTVPYRELRTDMSLTFVNFSIR